MTRGRTSRHPMYEYVSSGQYARDRERQGEINRREALTRNKAIRKLAASDDLVDRIMAIIAARNWHDFNVDDRGVLDLHADGMRKQQAWETARAIAEHVKSGKFPKIYNPGQPDASME